MHFIPQIYEQLFSTVTLENFVGEPHASGSTPFNTTTTCTAAVVLCISQHDIMLQKFTLYLLMWFRISISLPHPVNMRNLAALIVPDNDALKFTKSMIELELLQRTRREIIVLTEPNLLLSSIRHLEFINIICESLLSVEMKWISMRQKLGRFSIIIFSIY